MKKILLILLSCLALTSYLMVFAYQSTQNRIDNSPAEDIAKSQKLLIQALKRAKTPEYQYKLISTYPHDRQAFTEGLFVNGGYIYESTGLYAQSKLRKLNPVNGHILLERILPQQYFAEGIAMIGSSIYQLTYKEKTGFIYDKNTFKLKRTFQYPSEGWGLTTDGSQLIMSNGTNNLYFINPQTLKTTRTLQVTDLTHHPVDSINELEYIHGKIFANVWPTSVIIIISPGSGKVEGWFNIQALKPKPDCMTSNCAANGIAYDSQKDLLYITGKNWPSMYAIKVNFWITSAKRCAASQ